MTYTKNAGDNHNDYIEFKYNETRSIKTSTQFKLLLSQDKSPLGFFLAAGCPRSVKEGGNPILPDMKGLTKIISDAHEADAANSPYKRFIDVMGKAGNDSGEDVCGEGCINETFRVFKDNEICQYGEYRTKRLVMEAWYKFGYDKRL